MTIPVGDESPPAPGRQAHALPGVEVGTGVARVGVGGDREFGIQLVDRDREHGR